jgi:uncharacterized protein (TIGR02231 family)
MRVLNPLNTLLTLPFPALLLLAGAAQAAPPPIDRVVVFGDRAQVTRTVDVTCQGGSARAVFFPLPESLDERTVRAEASGTALAVGTSLSTRPLEEDRDARAEAARAAVRETEVELAALRARKARIDGRRETVNGLSSYAESVLREDLRDPARDLRTWTQTLDRMRAEMVRFSESLAEVTIALRAAQRELKQRQTRAQLLDPKRAERGRAVEVAVDCKGATKATVRLAYVVPGATWQPEYDLRTSIQGNLAKSAKASTGPAKIEWVTSAVISQSTGEDWTDAQVVLSSARPWLGVSAPEPRMLKLSARAAGERKVLVSATEKRERVAGGGKSRGKRASSATVADAGTAITLTLPTRISVASDGRPYWVPIDSKTTSGTIEYVAMPGKAAGVWQVARFTNPVGYPLLAGRVHAYRRGTYMGDDALAHHGVGAPIEASLGQDAQLRLERAPITDHKALKAVFGGLFGKDRVITRAYEIVLKNGSAAPAKINVRELLPVSKSAAIKVAITQSGTTQGYTLDAERGIITWTPTIAPGAEARLSYAYTVTLPEDWAVQD